nr:wall-associated receptor kinase-like 20 [Ziziphus jujuba var. spinosa]
MVISVPYCNTLVYELVNGAMGIWNDRWAIGAAGICLAITHMRLKYRSSTKVQNYLMWVVGSGKLDPEYLPSSQLTEKNDVYGFGVVLAELPTSKKAVFFDREEGEINLAMLLLREIKDYCLPHVPDGDIVDEVNMEEVKKVANLLKMCFSVKGDERPTMEELANELEGLINF